MRVDGICALDALTKREALPIHLYDPVSFDKSELLPNGSYL